MNQPSFYEELSKFKIGINSCNIPNNLRRHFEAPPQFQNIIQIPLTEQFPLQEQAKKNKKTPDEIKKEFIETQLEYIRDNIDINEDSLTIPMIQGPVIEINGDFESEEDFINFKKAIAVEYRRKSETLGFKTPIKVCASTICINPAIPGFEYCTYHLPQDAHFDKQIFLKQCSYTDEKGQCKTPCSSINDKCLTHRNQINQRRRRNVV